MTTARAMLPCLVLALCACAPTRNGDRAPARTHVVDAGQATTNTAGQFDWSSEVDAGRHVRVTNVNGNVTIVPGTGRTLKVHADKSGPGADDVRIEIDADPRGVSIKTIPPQRETTHEDAAKVDYRIELPADLALAATVVNGNIEVTAPATRVELESVNGSITAQGTREIDANTVNGNIVIAWPGGAGGHTDLEAVNGSLELRLPATTNGKLEINTVSGRIKSDFPLERSKQLVGAQASATLGDGGASMRLNTVNGRIRVAKL